MISISRLPASIFASPEIRTLPSRVWQLAGLVALSLACLQPLPARAQSAKVAADLQTVLSAGTTPVINWARDVNGVRPPGRRRPPPCVR